MSGETCGLSVAWVGDCPRLKPCHLHSGVKCCVCLKPATRECPETIGLVCGFPLCDSCHHKPGTSFAHMKEGGSDAI